MTSVRTRALSQMHFCVLLWGCTAVLGRLITLPALPLVFWRMLIVVVVLAAVPRVWRAVRAMPWRLVAALAGVGSLVALHWLTFYASIKLSNASVGATCMALAPVFLAVVEPLIVRRPFDPRDLLLGVAAVPGVWLVIGGVPSGMLKGIAIGVLSAFLVAVFGAFNKRLIQGADVLAATAIQLGAGTLLMMALAPFLPHDGPLFPIPGARDLGYLLVLSIGCTLLPYTLALTALRHLSAFVAQLVTNLEPVYAILLAIPLLGEHHELSLRFYVGVSIILGAVLVYPLLQRGRPPMPESSATTSPSKF